MNVLYRSQIEICRLLEALATNHCSASVKFETRMVVLHILHVDADNGYFVCSYCANKLLNSALLKEPSLKFTARLNDADLVFEASNPAEALFDGQPCIQFALPDALISYHGRSQPRLLIPSEASLRCIADAEGVLPFEAHIVDISHEGLGGVVFDREVHLKPEDVLKRCRIIIPDDGAVVADLEVRYVTAIALPDGVPAFRAGFRFIQTPDEIPELIDFFNQDLDRAA